MIDACASHKSFRPRGDDPPKGPGRNPKVDFEGQPRANDAHVSTTDQNARLFKKAEGTTSRLCPMSYVLMYSRNGLVVEVATTLATGKAGARRPSSSWLDTPGEVRRSGRTKVITPATSWRAVADWA